MDSQSSTPLRIVGQPSDNSGGILTAAWNFFKQGAFRGFVRKCGRRWHRDSPSDHHLVDGDDR